MEIDDLIEDEINLYFEKSEEKGAEDTPVRETNNEEIEERS